MGGLPDEVRVIAAFALALGVTALVVPPMRQLAIRTDFLDYPFGYKQHPEATPYLGGAAVMAGFLVATIAFAGELGHLAPIVLSALALFVVGVVDDRVGLGIAPRLAIQVGAGMTLWAAGFEWGLGSESAEFAVTVFWVVGVTNAFNLMDNLDGATGTVGAVSAAGAGTLAAANGDPALGALAFALAGACTGFLPFNLARPSKIFLGDGGSMPVGLVVAAVVMSSPESSLGWAGLLAAAPLVGLPILDTTLVVISRSRRGAAVLSGGRDHLTHRLFALLGSVRGVAVILALTQAGLCLLGLGLDNLHQEQIALAAGGYLACGVFAIALLDGPPKLPLGIARNLGLAREPAAEEHSV